MAFADRLAARAFLRERVGSRVVMPVTPPIADLSLQIAGLAQMEALREQTPALSPVAAFIGRHPIPKPLRADYDELCGRRDVAAVLDGLPAGSTTFHDVPWTPAEGTIHAVVVGPSGVFVVSTMHVPSQMVLVMKDSLLVDGTESQELTRLEAQTDWVTARLRLGRGDFAPRPLLVVTGFRHLDVRQGPSRVTVLSTTGLQEWLARRAPAFSPLRAAELTSLARRPDTWGLPASWTPPVPPPGVHAHLAAIRQASARARRVRLAWGLVAAVGTAELATCAWSWWG